MSLHNYLHEKKTKRRLQMFLHFFPQKMSRFSDQKLLQFWSNKQLTFIVRTPVLNKNLELTMATKLYLKYLN